MLGHNKANCPNLKEKESYKKKKKRAIKAESTWDESGDDSNDDSSNEETANMCFMAHGEESTEYSSNETTQHIIKTIEDGGAHVGIQISPTILLWCRNYIEKILYHQQLKN